MSRASRFRSVHPTEYLFELNGVGYVYRTGPFYYVRNLQNKTTQRIPAAQAKALKEQEAGK